MSALIRNTRRRMARRLIRPFALAAGLAILSLMAITVSARVLTVGQYVALITTTLGLCLVPILLYTSARRSGQKMDPDLVSIADSIESIRTWGVVESSRDPLSKRARRELIQSLPMLSEGDSKLMTDRQLADLRRFVTPRFADYDPYLVVEVIKALDRIGDTGCLTLVQRLAGMK